jgi:D-alanyl-D-alanine carboxypeptidase
MGSRKVGRRASAAGVVIAAILSLALLPASVSGAVSEAAARRKVVAALEADLAANPTIPGEAVAARAPGLAVTEATGLADRAAGTALAPETPFRVASVTKTFVAATVLRLAERHRVALDAPIARYLPVATVDLLRAGGYRPRVITVRQLLEHTAGLFDYATSAAYDDLNTRDPEHRWTAAEQLRFAVEHGHPLAEPGREYHYADTGYVLLGQIIERVTGESLAAAVRRVLDFRKLGLGHTYWESLEPGPSNEPARAHQYSDDFDNVALDASADLYGGGGLVSTVSDLARFYRALFHGEIFHRGKTLRTMTHVSKAGRQAGAGLGIFRLDVDGETCFGHPGWWGTEVIHCPRLDLTFARTMNQADDGDFDSGPLERVLANLARATR